MATTKIAIRRSRGDRKAVSRGRTARVGVRAEAIGNHEKEDNLSALLTEMLAESGGPLTMEERNAADYHLGISRRSLKPRSPRR